MAYSSKHTTRGKVYKHLKGYSWDYVPPKAYRNIEIDRLRREQRGLIEAKRKETQHQFEVARLEINMRYNELCKMDVEDKDIGPSFMNLCDSDEEETKEIIDLTHSDDDMDFSDPDFILDEYESMPESAFDA